MPALTCSCCGAEITAPKFKDGNAYGWACYGRLFGCKGKKPDVFVPVEVVRIERYGNVVDSTDGLAHVDLIVRKNGKLYGLMVLLTEDRMTAFNQHGQWFCSLHTLKHYWPTTKRGEPINWSE
jgi:hypothetical protein